MDLGKEMAENLNKLKKANTIILVEGKKDKEALVSLGMTQIMTVQGKPLYQIAENVAAKYKECVILTDLDAEGKKLFAYFRRALSERGVRLDNSFRLFLFRRTPVRHIEGLPHYLRRWE